jgi:hypothetical protein
MLRDTVEESSIELVESSFMPAAGGKSAAAPDWRVVDRALREIRRSRAGLDAEEARWLRAAEEMQIWRPLGMVSALDYLERVLGYAPRTAQERLRVARALGTLPEMSGALASDGLSYSAVRELTRVATPTTEASWIAAAQGKSLRQIEELVADHRPGDRPDDPPDPEVRMRVVRFELSAETFAVLRQVRTALDDEHGTNLADDDFVAALCHAVLEGTGSAEPTGRAKFQIAVTVCERCRQGWQEGAGAQIAIGPAAVGRAMCDAQHIGSLDGADPERAHQDIPPSVVRFVWRRDGGRCRVPGCRSARGLEVHHLVHRADGGGHDPINLCLLCSSCHGSHHRGALAIRGTADCVEVQRLADETAGRDCRSRGRCDGICTGPVADTGAGASAGGAAIGADAHVRVGIPFPVSVEEREPLSRSVAASSARVVADNRQDPNAIRRAVAVEAHAGAGALVSGGRSERSDACADTQSSANARRGHATAAKPINAGGAADQPAHVGAMDAAAPVREGARRNAGRAASNPRREGIDFDEACLRTMAKLALTTMGWKPTVARAAVAAAIEAHGEDITLEHLVRESLRRCRGAKA